MIKLLLIILCSSAFIMQINSSSPNKFGLKTTNGQVLELLDLATKATVHFSYAETQYTYTYKNTLNHSVEARFYISPSDIFIFSKFEAILNNQTKITEKIHEKKTARDMCGWDPKRVRTVTYYEVSNETPKTLSFNLGKIPSNETVQIIFSAIQPLQLISNELYGLQFPAVLDEKSSSGLDWKIQIEVKSNSPFAILDGPTHILTSELESSSRSKLFKAAWNASVEPNKDFKCTIYVGSEKLGKFETVLGTHPQDHNDHVIMVDFMPDLEAIESEITQNLQETGNYDLMRDPSFEIECLDFEDQKVQSKRYFPNYLWNGQSVIKWTFLNNITQIKSCQAEFSYFNGREDKKIIEKIAIHEIQEVTDVWHKVVSDVAIRQMQEGLRQDSILVPESTVEDIVSLSTKYQVFSDFTCSLGIISDALAREDNETGDYLCTRNADIDEESDITDGCAWCGVDIDVSYNNPGWDSLLSDSDEFDYEYDFEDEIEGPEFGGVFDLDELETIVIDGEEDS